MKIEKFSDLVVWQEAHRLALAVYKLTTQFPANERFGIVAQVRRSAASICANIAEGYGRRTTKELLRSLQIARGELEETRYFLILSRDLGFMDVEEFGRLGSQCDLVGKLLSALSRSLKEKLGA